MRTGYQADEFNWAQNNINLAQNRTDELAKASNEKSSLKKKAYRIKILMPCLQMIVQEKRIKKLRQLYFLLFIKNDLLNR
jgi:hypothetical protein